MSDNELIFGGYSEAFFLKWLEAKEVISIDASRYEGATLIHDLNNRVPADWDQTFDVVIDAGTLEHVFNFPTALESCMRMIKKGGVMFWSMPANNYCGHGFYQFSPELIFRVFSPAYGFHIEEILLFTHPFPGAELSSQMSFYSIRDPDEVRCRVAFMNDKPAGLLVAARREQILELFSPFPQQSDYARAWQGTEVEPHIFSSAKNSVWITLANRLAIWLEQNLPLRSRNWLAGQYQKRYLLNLRNKRLFKLNNSVPRKTEA